MNFNRYLYWQPQCNLVIDPGCKIPLIRIQGIYTFDERVKGPRNWDKFNFTLMRKSINLSPCSVPAPICIAPSATVCSATGWTPCLAPGCAPETLSWTVAGVNCQGPVAATSAGSDSNIVVSTNANTGFAIFN